MPSATIDFGIDLGTSNSSIACCRNAHVRIFETCDSRPITPSVVNIGKSGRILVGKRAYDVWTSDPENTHAEFKRWIGYSDTLLFPASNRRMTAEELSAEVLKSLRADVQRATGEDITAAVITVPAAFGALQCEATGRAAKLAGFVNAPLLQEPIAAAIAYGASPHERSKRWLVFDLGGGTLDIAIVSTRNGRLAILEHQGNNRLGGKDIDRAIAEHLLLALLAERFKLPDRIQQPAQYDGLFRNLVRIAEQAKIALTTADSIPVDVSNVGTDLLGIPIERSLVLTRGDLEQQIQPLLAKCLELVALALAGARISAAEIDRVILVGGPTRIPAVRAALSSVLGDKFDFSIDPMTVVAQGAALYASTLENQFSPVAESNALSPTLSGTVTIQLNHERASGTPTSPVVGIIAGPDKSQIHEIKIDADGSIWTSGWIPLVANRFAAEVMLAPGKSSTHYTMAARSGSGIPIPITPSTFSIASMLSMGATPLPHTIAIEITSSQGTERFDPIFKRHGVLPAEARRTYRAERTLRPSDHDETLPIKFWEIEVSEDASEKWWAGCIKIPADRLRRPLIEGSDIELIINIDKSRKMTVDTFIPSLNQHFSDDVYVPDAPTTGDQLQSQLNLCFDRIARIFQLVYAMERDELAIDARNIQLQLESIAERIQQEQHRNNRDPDALLTPTDLLRKLRVMITQIEEQLETERTISPLIISIRADQRFTGNVISRYGKDADREAFERLTAQLDRYIKARDYRGIKYVEQQLAELRGSIIVNQRAYYEAWLRAYSRPGYAFLNVDSAQQYLRYAKDAVVRGDFPALRDAIHQLHALCPPDQIEIADDQAKRSGLKEC